MTSTSSSKQSVALVTGGGQGLGETICEALALDGMAVVVADINTATAKSTTGRLVEGGFNAFAVELDVASEESAKTAIKTVIDKFGRIDALINNAAIDITLPLEELSIEDWSRVVQTNLTGPFMMAKLCLPYLLQQQGAIVNIASTASRRAWPNAVVYHATKWGLLGMSHAMHAELRQRGIKVTAVIAGGMRTPFLLDRFPDLDPEVLQNPANVASAVRFALSMPAESVIPELMVLPMRETSWP